MKHRLTKRVVEAASPGFVWDTDLVGFGLKVNPSGKRVFLVQKRPHKGAKTLKRYTLGAYPLLSPEEARTQAKALLATLTLGGPVSATRRHPEQLFKSQIEDYYHSHVLAKLKETTQRDMRYMIDKHLIPEFGELNLSEVTHSLVRSFHTRLGSKHPYRANRVLALLSKFFSWKRILSNPCVGIEKFRERRREINELNLAPLLDPKVHPAIRLLLLTGMRKSEVLSLRWEHFSPSTRSLQLPDSKTGERTIYLSDPALELLQACQPKPQGWVFPAHRPRRLGLLPSHLRGLQKIWKQTLRNVGLPLDLRIHDLRHHYASQAVLHIPLTLVGGLLGHKDIKTTHRYIHNNNQDLVQAAQLVGDHLPGFGETR